MFSFRDTWKHCKPVLDIGYFANVLDIGHGRGLAITTDGVGTKTLVAAALNKFDTIGIDLVAMNVNDLLCVGAVPAFMVDCLSVPSLIRFPIEAVFTGIKTGAEMAGVAVVGGETAEIPGILSDRGMTFDLSGAAGGFLPLSRLIDGSQVEAGDIVIGIESSGIHSNGLTKARKVLPKDYDYHTCLFSLRGHSIGEELLTPTHIYVSEIISLLNSPVRVKGLANITGGGFKNLSRMHAEVGFVVDAQEFPPPWPIFQLLQSWGDLSLEDMFSTFNMGVGFCAIVPAADRHPALDIIRECGKNAYVIGSAVADPERRVRILDKGEEIALSVY